MTDPPAPAPDDLREEWSRENEEICQLLGRALGYPRYCDDQKNFPGATDADGVCVGDHVAVTLAMEAAAALAARDAEIAKWRQALESIAANTCCDRCQEAALVARAALAAERTQDTL